VAQYFSIHTGNPQTRLIRQAAEILRAGGLVVYPTDSCYALGCHLGEKGALERMRRIRGLGGDHYFTLVCRNLSEVGQYALVNNVQYRVLKAATPGSYTFILTATREVPKRLLHPKRKTIGLRVPDHSVAHALVEEMDAPILSTTLIFPGDEMPMNDASQIRDRLEDQVELVIDSGPCGIEMTTVVDLTGEAPVILRQGKGSTAVFGINA
jgi:tRNA threonylcarbamoyl adenosine modification protein (Sua5/YciO/YrdC/YwlC family)